MPKNQVAIAPTITAYDVHEYRMQLERVSHFADRVHVDLMDGIFAPTKSPDIDLLWLPNGIQADVHVMFQHPDKQIKKILRLNPHLVIVQVEADKDSVMAVIAGLKKTKVRVGVSLLASTSVHDTFVANCIGRVDYVLIFSGNLGYHGGEANLELLHKVSEIRAINATCEIAWDGGINKDNALSLVSGGINVLNVGGSIQRAPDAEVAYKELLKVVTSDRH